jgi:thiol-disulfide isomerase/thioredoxin
MPKKIFLAILGVFILNAMLFAQVDSTFEVKLNVKGVTDCKLYVTEFYGGNLTKNNQYEFKNGEAILKGAGLKPFIARITFSSNNQFVKTASSGGYYPSKAASLWAVIYPGARFSIDGSVENKDFIDLYPKDGGENDYLAELNKRIMPLINKAINITLEINKNKSMSPEEKKRLTDNQEALSKQSNDEKVSFIKSKPNSMACLWIMEDMLIRSEIEPLSLEPVLAKVDVQKYGTNNFYIAVKDRIEGAKRTSPGKKCPEIITSDSFDGKLFNSESMRGKYMIIDFWGTWCGPCMAGIPKMKAFRDKHADKLQILSISNDKTVDGWKSVINQKQMDWPNILIGPGEKNYVNKFNVQGFPTKILVSPDGIILYRESGENEDFYEKLEKLISQ